MDNGETILSIIIPVYQVPAGLLERCLNSARSVQGISKEIILVADGVGLPVREQLAVRELMADSASNARYYEIAHQGVSAARNHGLEKATGEWVTFVDADDCLSDEFASVFTLLARDGRPDVVIMDYYMKQNNTARKHLYRKSEVGEISTEDFTRDILRPQSGAGFAWGKLFRRSWLQNERIHFDRNLSVTEDAEFMLQIALRNPVVRYIPCGCYYHCYNPESAVHKFREDYVKRYKDGLEAMRILLSENGVFDRYRDSYANCVLYHVLLIAVNYSFHPQNWEKDKIAGFKAMMRDPLICESLPDIRLRDFSMTRKAAIICIRLHFYSGVRMIAAVRHRKRKQG